VTALYKSGDTIYQRKVKLNVSGLTDPTRSPGARGRTTKGVTPGPGGLCDQRNVSRLVQWSSSPDPVGGDAV